MGEKVMTSVDLVAAERKRQIAIEGWTADHDDEHEDGSLAQAAAAYALGGGRTTNIDGSRVIDIWPTSWGAEGEKIKDKPRLRQLVVAGALIVAEIDRVLRADAAAVARGETEG